MLGKRINKKWLVIAMAETEQVASEHWFEWGAKRRAKRLRQAKSKQKPKPTYLVIHRSLWLSR